MRFWLILIFGSLTFCLRAQQYNGSRLSALGNADAAIKDSWNVHGNPSGITGVENATLSLNYVTNFFLRELSTQAVNGILPFHDNFIGITLHRYGLEGYTKISVALAYARKFGALSVGLGGTITQTSISGYGSINKYVISPGIQYAISSTVTIGTYCNTSINSYAGLQIPFDLHLGLTYQPNPYILVAYSVSKSTENGLNNQLGIEYQPYTQFFIRAGLDLRPFTQYAGIGLAHKKIVLNISLAKSTINYSPQIELRYAF